MIEIRKAGFNNKGAELMLIAIMQNIRKKYPDQLFTMESSTKAGSQPFNKLQEYLIYPKASLKLNSNDFSWIFKVMPNKLLEKFGLVQEKDIDVIFDASGFSYSDQWGPLSSQILEKDIYRWKKMKKKVILMPQAFGPFFNKNVRKSSANAFSLADLIFARDKISYDYLLSLGIKENNIHLFPDFTNLVGGTLPHNFNKLDHRICIVPNSRMIDKLSGDDTDYTSFLKHCISYLANKGEKPFILVHEEKDLDFCMKIKNSFSNRHIPLVFETDPLMIKGIIGSSLFSIGSRFHGLVSALSQGVPVLATGWSHKYMELVSDYDCRESLIDISISEFDLKHKLDLYTQQEYINNLSQKLAIRSKLLKKKSEEMWSLVYEIIDPVLGADR